MTSSQIQLQIQAHKQIPQKALSIKALNNQKLKKP